MWEVIPVVLKRPAGGVKHLVVAEFTKELIITPIPVHCSSLANDIKVEKDWSDWACGEAKASARVPPSARSSFARAMTCDKRWDGHA